MTNASFQPPKPYLVMWDINISSQYDFSYLTSASFLVLPLLKIAVGRQLFMAGAVPRASASILQGGCGAVPARAVPLPARTGKCARNRTGTSCPSHRHPEPVTCSVSPPPCSGGPSLSVLGVKFDFFTRVGWVSCTSVVFCKSRILFPQ